MTRPGGTLVAEPGTAGLPRDGEEASVQLLRPAPDDAHAPAGESGTVIQSSPERPHGRPAPSGHGRALPSWPLLVLAVPATVAVWSGWVGIGQLTGFGEAHPLPGIWDSLHLDTAVTLPVGVEAYAAYALRAWLSGSAVSARTRRFARWSAIGSLALGMAGQVAYHLLTQAHASHAPWGITTAVACLPVLVLGMGAALTHLLRADASTRHQPRDEPASARQSAGNREDQAARAVHRATTAIRPEQLAAARAVARQLSASGQRVSRRSLRAAGLRGSNAELGVLALATGTRTTTDAARGQQPPAG
jgi:hypothetical protein